MTIIHSDPIIRAHVRNLVMAERRQSQSDTDWKNRLAGFGYAIQPSETGLRVVTLAHGVDVCSLPLYE